MSKNSGFQISLARLRRIVDTLKDQPPQTPITFEYMCSFFPKAYDNMQELLKDQYMKGYIDGKNETH